MGGGLVGVLCPSSAAGCSRGNTAAQCCCSRRAAPLFVTGAAAALCAADLNLTLSNTKNQYSHGEAVGAIFLNPVYSRTVF